MKDKSSPVIVIGMHRSGTSMITRMLDDCGLFVGKDLEYDHESLFFLRLNEWILRQANATWDNPFNLSFIDNYFIKNASRVVQKRINSFARIKYMGVHNYFTSPCIDQINSVWGWKDPRSTVTMDVWRSLYPNAKIVHIYRNPIDIASSLAQREAASRGQALNFKSLIKEKFLLGKSNFASSSRVLDLHQGVALWSEYTERAFKLSENLDVLHIRYESFLNAPAKHLSEVLRFIGISPDELLVTDLVQDVNKDRCFAFLNDADMLKLYTEITPKFELLLSKCDYNHLS